MTTHGAPSQGDLAYTLSAVAQRLQVAPDEEQTLAGIVGNAVATVPGVAYGGISQVQGREVTARVPTDELVSRCDQLQHELGQGPCMDAIRREHTVVVDDMAGENRWPDFAARAAKLGVGSLISFQLYVEGDNLGALNLYGATGVRFDVEARTVGELFATHAAIALSRAVQQRQMNQALASRDVIGQAKGILMERFALDADRAFSMLVQSSQETNMKLTEVARWLTTERS